MKLKLLFLILFYLALHAYASAQMNTSGRMELVFVDAQNGSQGEPSQNIPNKGYPGFIWQLRLYLDMPVSERSTIFSDLRLRSDGLNVDFAAIRLYLNAAKTIVLQAGVLGTPIGNVTARRSSKFNPLIHLPIMYDYRTSLPARPIADEAEFLANRGTGSGLRILNLGVYSPGVELRGTLAEVFDFSFALFNSAPSSLKWKNETERLNFTQRIGVRPLLGLNIGFSISNGPYLGQEIIAMLPPEKDLSSYLQTLYDFDFSFERGHLSIFAEGVINKWENPVHPDALKVSAYYLETKYKFLPHYFAALRIGHLLFEKIDFQNSKSVRWDDNIQRFEIGLGYYVARETLAKLVYQKNNTSRIDIKDDYIAVQLSSGF
ncbi:MAG: hypothetical protein DWQ05_18880 [Calditrichaeota bacterium]|nr:MAG: hypothetical protein DWQ05_18880 [Calditrichota bacterium]